jgi:prepilin-type N-terminal cleavage/methylation domain-containing protein
MSGVVKSARTRGFTLLELLISMVILGVVSALLFSNLGSTVNVANAVNVSNELLREGQMAQQVLTTSFKEACYVFPDSSVLSLSKTTKSFTRSNPFNAATSTEWVVNTDPVVGLLLPPETIEGDYLFLAYYALPRRQYVKGAASSINPGVDALNDQRTWVLMEYRKHLKPLNPPATTCAEFVLRSGAQLDLAEGNANLLLDYVQPQSPVNVLFGASGADATRGADSIRYQLVLEKTLPGGQIVRVGSGRAGTNLSGKVYPLNLGL